MGETNIGNLAVKLILNTASFVADADGAISKVGALSKAFTSIGEGAGKIAKESASSAMSFETAFTGVKKTVDAPAGNSNYFSDLRGQILDLSTELPSTATEIANVVSTAGQLGVASEDLMDFSTVMLQLASATNLSSDEAATKLAQFANVTGMSADDYGRLGSSVVALGNNMATTESQIVAFAQEMALPGANAGMTEDQILGWGAAAASLGLDAASTGTAFQRFTADITGAVAGTNDHLATFASVSGMAADEFAAAWETDASGAMQTFLAGVGQLGSAEQLQLWDNLGISQQQEIQMLGSLAGNTDLVTKSLGLSNSAWQENTALVNEADAANQTTAAKLQMIQNNAEALAISIGDALLPIINDILDAVKPVITQMTAFVNKHPALTKAILAIASAIGVVGVVLPTIANVVNAFKTLSGVTSVVGRIGPAFSGIGTTLSGVFSGITGAISAAIPAIAGFISSILPIVAAVGAVIAVILLLKKAYDTNFLGLKDKLEPVVTGFKNAFSSIGSYFSSLKDTFETSGFSGVFDKLKTDISGLWENTISPKLNEIKDNVVQWFAEFDLGESLSTLASTIGTAISGWWENTFLPAFETVKTNITNFFGGIDLGESMGKVAGTIATAVSGWWENTIKPAIGDIEKFFKDLFGGIDLTQSGKDIIESIKKGISDAWESLTQWFNGLFEDWDPLGGIKNFLGIGGETKERETGQAEIGTNPNEATAATDSSVTMPTGVMTVDTAALAPVSQEVIDSWTAFAEAVTAVNSAISTLIGLLGGGGAAEGAEGAGEAAGAAAEGASGGGALTGMLSAVAGEMTQASAAATILAGAFGILKTAGENLMTMLCTTGTDEEGNVTAGGGNNLYTSLGVVYGLIGDTWTQSQNLASCWTGALYTAAKKVYEYAGDIESAVRGMADAATAAASEYNAAAEAVFYFAAALAELEGAGGVTTGEKKSTFKGGGGGHMSERAAGGPVASGTTYLVGEEGPELFTPSRSGYIIPNDELASGGSDTVINVVFSGDVIGDEKSITAYVKRAVKAGIRQEVLIG